MYAHSIVLAVDGLSMRIWINNAAGRVNPPLSGGGTSQNDFAETSCQDAGWIRSADQQLNSSS